MITIEFDSYLANEVFKTISDTHEFSEVYVYSSESYEWELLISENPFKKTLVDFKNSIDTKDGLRCYVHPDKIKFETYDACYLIPISYKLELLDEDEDYSITELDDFDEE